MIDRPTPQTHGWPGRLLGLLVLAIVTALAPTARAQGTGTINGTVIDTTSGKYLEGAEVSVQGSGATTTTARDGSFSLTGVPAGAQSVVVHYPGLEAKTESVTVGAGQPASVTLRLSTGEVLKMGEYRVSGMKEGVAQAIALQKLSVQSKMVVAADQFGEVSEGNVGEYLKFLPGVSVDYNVNDARGISLRGLSTTFTIVAVDGTPMAGTSSQDDTRRFEFEQIAMNNVETTELYKTVTPDIPASSTGGFVNFVTKSAFDSEGIQRFTYNASLSAPATNLHFSKQGGVWGHKEEYTIRPSLEMNYARRISEKLGFNVNYRLSEKYDDSPRTTALWYQTSSATLPTIFTSTPQLATYAFTSEEKLTHREALAAKVDYRISDSTKLSLSGQWNWYDLNFTQRGPRFALGNAGSATVYGGGSVSGDTYTSAPGTISSIQNIFLYRNKFGTTYHSNLTLDHEFTPKAKGSLTAYYSRANGKYRDIQKGFISSTAIMSPGAATYGAFTIKGLDREMPVVSLTSTTGTPVSLDFVRNLGNYTFSNTATGTNFQSRPFTAIDTKQGIAGSFNYELDHFALPVKLETGFASDDTTRYILRQAIVGQINATTGPALQALVDPKYTRDVAFGFGSYQAVDPFTVWDTFKGSLGRVITDDVREFNEKNNAVYLRADVNATPELLLIGGLRWEKREMDARAQSRASQANGLPTRSKPASADLEYDEIYPSLSFKYTPRANRNIVVRGGISRTVGHPDYADLVPTITAESVTGLNDGSVTVPDPDLKPYFSTNIDLSFDYYFKHSGVVGIYAYTKDVKNYFIGNTMTGPDLRAVIDDYGYDPTGIASGTVVQNGGKSRLSGIELSYAQNLSFLPKPFDGLNVQANFTYVDVSVSDPDPSRALDLEYSQLRAVSPQTANFILGYRYRDFSVTTTTNWVSESLFGGFVAGTFVTGTRGTATLPDTRLANYRDEKLTTDVKLEYSINKHLAVYFLVRNIFNSQRIDYYRGYLPQNQHVVLPFNRYEFGEPHLTLGVRGRF
ncbi:MAG TPA: TonB-dependent receptor [Opitutaceae bacterium]|nr:TonB-dependent receptor [Opitutaceae bacterium]